MGEAMTWFQALVLGLVQGLTEFLPISSSAHLRIVSGVFFGDDAGASFTAVTQLGTEAAVLVYFAKDIQRIVVAWFTTLGMRWRERSQREVAVGDRVTTKLPVMDRSARDAHERDTQRELDYRIGWYVIIATIPIGMSGLPVQGPDPHRRAQPVADRVHADRVRARDRRAVSTSARKARPIEPTHHQRRHRDGPGAVSGADPRRLPLRRHLERRSVPRPRA